MFVFYIVIDFNLSIIVYFFFYTLIDKMKKV